MATHSSSFAWRISWTKEPGRLQSKGSQRVRHDWATNTFTFQMYWQWWDISDLAWFGPYQKLYTECWCQDRFCFHFSASKGDLLWPHGLQHTRLPCPLPSPGVCSNSCPLSQWCYPNISSSATLFSCPQSFPASGSFSVSQLFCISGQSIGAETSVSVLPMNSQGWFPLGLTGLISQSKRLSRVLSGTIWKHQSLTLSFLDGPTLTSIHDYWENHSVDSMNLCQQSDV